MNGFLWESGHLGWGIFALAVFTGLWWLLADLVWRFKKVQFAWLMAGLAAGWVIGAGLIVLAFWLGKL
ncbi:MAG TPA: hypothetical protein VFW60_00320 [Rhodanobacteraceae bacterium]|nr:hypothetical protein [Rhodanobacteraceae bacterium]